MSLPRGRRAAAHPLPRSAHSHATTLLASGVHPKVASEHLGHARVGITLDVYSHVIDNMQDTATAAVDAAFAEAKGSKAVAIPHIGGRKAPYIKRF